jgi:hypothetical protein
LGQAIWTQAANTAMNTTVEQVKLSCRGYRNAGHRGGAEEEAQPNPVIAS